MKHPILIVAADPDEIHYLKHELQAGGVENPLVFLPSAEAAIDYLEAVCVADLKSRRFTPCLLLVDLAISHEEVRVLTEWIHAHEAVSDITVAELDDSDFSQETADGANLSLPRRPDAATLRETAEHACS